MTIITTYDTLVENVVAVTEDDGTEFASYLPTAISLAEDKVIRECDFVDLTVKTTGSLVVGTNTVAKPTGHRYDHYFFITLASGSRKNLKRKTDDFIVDYWPDTSVTGEPRYYGDDSQTNFVLAPTPDATLAYEIKTTNAPTKLSTSNQTNYFVTNVPDLLYFATMVETVKFLKAWSQLPVWESYYVAARDSWNQEQSRRRRDDGTNPLNPEGGQNNIKNNIESRTRS